MKSAHIALLHVSGSTPLRGQPREAVQLAEGFGEKQQTRLVDQGAGEGGLLEYSDLELVWIGIAEARKTAEAQGVVAVAGVPRQQATGSRPRAALSCTLLPGNSVGSWKTTTPEGPTKATNTPGATLKLMSTSTGKAAPRRLKVWLTLRTESAAPTRDGGGSASKSSRGPARASGKVISIPMALGSMTHITTAPTPSAKRQLVTNAAWAAICRPSGPFE